MARFWAILSAFIFVFSVAHAAPRDVVTRHSVHPRHHAEHLDASPPMEPRRSSLAYVPLLHFAAFQPRTENPLPAASPLSETAVRVSRIAAQKGDRQFLIIDKVHGVLILFENGVPVFTGPALTGLSLADRLPADALSKSYAQQTGVQYRVTPAGRFTVSPGHDDAYGVTFDINEIQGPDWAIAIHAVPMGPGHREARLRSALDQDKHITEGCVNVDASTMRQLTRLLPRHGGTPIYILPNDESLLTKLF
jgi:hypothetical protein